MKLANALSHVVNTSKSDIRTIGEFASDADRALIARQGKLPAVDFTANEAEQLVAFGKALAAAAAAADHGAERPGISKGPGMTETMVSERVAAFITQSIEPYQQQNFLAEMVLSYLMARQEAFIKDYLFVVLTHKRNALRSNATVTYEELAAHKSVNSLWASLAQKEVDALGYGSIDDVATYFSKKFNIDLVAFEGWPTLREHSFRRNIIIHNKGRVNDVYRQKIGAAKKTGRVHTDMEYVSAAAKNVTGFIDYVHSKVCKKFKLSR